jgi:hypothetical protein
MALAETAHAPERIKAMIKIFMAEIFTKSLPLIF